MPLFDKYRNLYFTNINLFYLKSKCSNLKPNVFVLESCCHQIAHPCRTFPKVRCVLTSFVNTIQIQKLCNSNLVILILYVFAFYFKLNAITHTDCIAVSRLSSLFCNID